jgi:hypothetical protein
MVHFSCGLKMAGFLLAVNPIDPYLKMEETLHGLRPMN